MVKVNAMSFAKMMRLLLEGPHTAHELAEETGLFKRTVYESIHALEKEKVVHVSAWEKDARGADHTPVYKMGPGKRAVRSKMTGAERQAKSRAKKRALLEIQMFAGPTTEVNHE